MPALRPAPAGSVRQAPDLEELESEGLHALEDPVELGLVADAAVQHGLDALGVALERVEAGEQGGAETTADAELVLRRGHDGKLPRRRGDESPARVIAGPAGTVRRTGSPRRVRRARPGPPDDRAPQRKEQRYGDLSGGRPVGGDPRHGRGTDRLLVDVARDGRHLDHRRPRRAAVRHAVDHDRRRHHRADVPVRRHAAVRSRRAVGRGGALAGARVRGPPRRRGHRRAVQPEEHLRRDGRHPRLPVPRRVGDLDRRGAGEPRRQRPLVARTDLRDPHGDHGLLDERPVLHPEGVPPAGLRRHLGADEGRHRHRPGLPGAPAAPRAGLTARGPAAPGTTPRPGCGRTAARRACARFAWGRTPLSGLRAGCDRRHVAAEVIAPHAPAAPRAELVAALPAPASAAVRRPRLEARLDELAERGVVAVTAPPGSGKTVVLASWAPARDAAWVSLRLEHLDAVRLWHDIAAALRPLGVELGAPPPPGRPAADDARALRTALGRAPRRVTLVLDDLHVLHGPALSLVATLAAECGSSLGLLVASRSAPALPLGRMRLESRLGELRGDELAFTADEADALLDADGLSLHPDQVARLVARTEGWAAGLRLAALSLRAEPDTDAFLADFTGDDHSVADYLSGEVLALQTPATREFLLRTSIAERVCGDLADALTGRADGARTLAELHRAGLFLTPVDRHERWFRYHPLFAELLRARLRIHDSGLVPELHLRAARWLAGGGLGREALPHALGAGDPAAVSDLLADHWLDLLVGGQAPEAVLAAARLRPDDRRLAVAAAGACLATGDPSGAEAVLPPAAAGAEDDVAALGALLRARAEGDAPAARTAAARVLRRRPVDGPRAVSAHDTRRAIALLHLGVTEFDAGSPDAAGHALEAASALAVDARRERVLLECLGRMAALELVAGRLTRAASAARAAAALAAGARWERTAPAAWAAAALGAVHWLRDERREAEACGDAAMAAAYASGEVGAVQAVRLLRAHGHAARGDPDRGRALLGAVLAGDEGDEGDGPVVRAWVDALGPCPWAHDDDAAGADPLAAAALRLARGDALSALRRVEDPATAGAHPTRRLHA